MIYSKLYSHDISLIMQLHACIYIVCQFSMMLINLCIYNFVKMIMLAIPLVRSNIGNYYVLIEYMTIIIKLYYVAIASYVNYHAYIYI